MRVMSTTEVRWTIMRDLPGVVAGAAGTGWARQDYLSALKRRNTVGMLAERGDEVVGHMVFCLFKGSLDLVQFWAADAEAAQALLEELVDKAGRHKRKVLAVPYRLVREHAGVAICSDADPGLSRVVLTGLPDMPPSDNARQVLTGLGGPAIAADALEDDGCGDEELLAALRARGSLALLIARQWVGDVTTRPLARRGGSAP